MATVNKSCQLHSKAANGDVLKLYPNTLIANVDGLQSALDGKVNTVSGKGLSTNDYTTAEKNKLAGIAAGATANTGTVTQVKVGSKAYNPSSGVVSLPAYPSDTNTHRPIQVNGTQVLGDNTTAFNLKAGSNVSLSNSSGTVTIAATDTTYSAVTQSANGLMSAADKIKLDGLTPGQITISAGSGFTISDVFSYKCNGLAWFSLMAKCSNQLLQGQSYKVATVDENTLKRGNPVVVLNAYVNGTSIPINGYMPQWSTQEINVVSESNNIPANSSIFISGVYRFY